MAAPKKKNPAKSKAKTTSAAKAPAKKQPAAPAANKDMVQDTIQLVQGFQINTLIALGLSVAFVIFQLFPDLRYIWWLNFPAAVGAGYFFWSQEKNVSGLEAKVCRWGLFAVVAVFVWRDIQISNTLYDISQGRFNLNEFFSG